MAASTPRTEVVEIDGIHFRIQALRGRRGFRGTRALQVTIGHTGYQMITNPAAEFWKADLEAQLVALAQFESRTGASYDAGELAMVELLAYSRDAGGQGVSYQIDGGEWIPVTSMKTLDRFACVDHLTWEALRWEMIKLCYRPTSAGGGTSVDTPSAATTSTTASSPAGKAKPQQTGTPRETTTPPLGMSGG